MSTATRELFADPVAIAEALKPILLPGQVTELRAFEVVLPGSNYTHKTVSGYFNDPDKLAAAAATIKQAAGAYFVPNVVKQELLARAVNKIRPLKDKDATTSDQQIQRRRYLLIDCDSQKATGISASDEEHDLALERAIQVDAYLSDMGWPAGIRGDSGNGGHLMYAIDEPAEDDGLIKQCLEALADMFDDDRVKVDKTVFNPSRIWRLYGAMNGKGDIEAAELGRPHRRAKIISTPEALETVPTAKLRALAALAPPPPEPPARHNGNGQTNGKPWDMEEFISKNNIPVHSRSTWKNATKWTLEACPFNSEHTAPDAALYQFADGPLKFKCSHNSCASFRWEQFRQHYDPSCYDRRNDYKQNGHDGNHGSHPPHGTAEESQARHPWEQVGPPLSLEELEDQFPELPPAIIHGLLREGETANIIAASKVGKSWLMYEIGLCVATGKRIWDTYGTVPGDVLLIDNELREAVLSFRLKLVRKAMGLGPEDLKNKDGTGKLAVRSLRGRLLDIHGIAAWLRKHVKPGQYKLIIIDAYYRILPAEMSENDNNPTTQLYNLLDALSLELGCAFALVHHASKGSQTGKAVTDVGSGAGAMSRAADCHMVLRPHEEPGVVVKEVAVRSWPPVDPLCLRYIHPRWVVADGLDPAALKPDRIKTTINQIADRAEACWKEHGPQLRSAVRAKLQISGEKINEVVELLLAQKRIEPCDIPKGKGFTTGYQIVRTAVDNGGQSSQSRARGETRGLLKSSPSTQLPSVHADGNTEEQSTAGTD